MKKVMCLFLSLAILFSFCSCSVEKPDSGSGSDPTGSPENTNQTETKEPEESKQPTEEAVETQVLLDDSGVKVTATGLDKSGWFGAELKVQIENNTENNLTFQVRSASVNGYMVETMFSSDVAAGKKANDGITFMSSDLEACGIETIADVEFSFHIFTSEGWDTYLDTDLVQVKTSAAEDYNYSFDDSGDELYNGNGIRIVSKGFLDEESVFGPSLVVFIENTSGQSVTVQVRDVSVNGFMVDTIFSSEVSSGKRSVDGITVMSSIMEENNIENIEEMEFSFHIFATDGWDTIEDTAPIVVNAK